MLTQFTGRMFLLVATYGSPSIQVKWIWFYIPSLYHSRKAQQQGWAGLACHPQDEVVPHQEQRSMLRCCCTFFFINFLQLRILTWTASMRTPTTVVPTGLNVRSTNLFVFVAFITFFVIRINNFFFQAKLGVVSWVPDLIDQTGRSPPLFAKKVDLDNLVHSCSDHSVEILK